MTPPDAGPDSVWADAQLAAALCAVAPSKLGGVALRACPGPVRDAWLELLGELLPEDQPLRRIPVHISESRLLGGLDLAATLRAGRPTAEQGLLAQCDGGVAMLVMAERAARSTISHLSAALDQGELALQRDGLQGRIMAKIGVVALDEGVSEEEAVAPALRDRLALHLDLHSLGIRDLAGAAFDRATIDAARQRLPAIVCPDQSQQALCTAALALGVESLRASLLAVGVARVAAALARARVVDDAALEVAVRLVLLPRATRVPAPQEPERSQTDQEKNAAPPAESQDQASSSDGREEAGDQDEPREKPREEPQTRQPQPLEDRLLEAARAAIPPDVLARLQAGVDQHRRNATSQGKSGAASRQRLRGRPMGTIAGDPRNGARLHLVATLRTAAPWQALRKRQAVAAGREPRGLLVSREDFRVTRFRQRTQSTTIFVVDASGSAALHRLAEAKGAIELLLADCYVRRDEVALVAFRGERAEMLLPPTRSLVRAKRNLAALPGGGATPLTSAIDVTMALVDQVQRGGGTPGYVMLTDGRGNICRDGSRGRQAASAEALAAAGGLRRLAVRGMVIDTSPRPHRSAGELAGALGALYLPLPHADATALRDAVQSATL